MHYQHPLKIIGEIARLHIGAFVRGKEKFLVTEYIAPGEKVAPRFLSSLTTGRFLSRLNAPSDWRERYAHPTRQSGRIAPVRTAE